MLVGNAINAIRIHSVCLLTRLNMREKLSRIIRRFYFPVGEWETTTMIMMMMMITMTMICNCKKGSLLWILLVHFNSTCFVYCDNDDRGLDAWRVLLPLTASERGRVDPSPLRPICIWTRQYSFLAMLRFTLSRRNFPRGSNTRETAGFWMLLKTGSLDKWMQCESFVSAKPSWYISNYVTL